LILTDEELKELSLDELLALIEYEDKRYGKISLRRLLKRLNFFLDTITDKEIKEKAIARVYNEIINDIHFEKNQIELLYSISNKKLKSKTIFKSFEPILHNFDKDIALKVLESVTDEELKDKTIFKSFGLILYYFDKDIALEVLESITNKELKDKTIVYFFREIVDNFNKSQSLELFESISSNSLKKELIKDCIHDIKDKYIYDKKVFELLDFIPNMDSKNKLIIKHFKRIKNQFNVMRMMKLITSISNIPLQRKLLLEYTNDDKIFHISLDTLIKNNVLIQKILEKIDQAKEDKALNILDSISNKDEQEEIILIFFSIIIDKFKKDSILYVLNLIYTRDLKEKIVAKYFGKLLDKLDKDKTIELLNYISNKELKENIINKFLKNILNVFHENTILELLYSISNYTLKDKIIDKLVNKIGEKKSINEIFKFLKSIKDSSLRKKIEIRYINIYSNVEMVEYLDFISNRILKEKIISRYFSNILKKFSDNEVFNLLKSISDKELKNKAIKNSYTTLVEKFDEYNIIEILYDISDKNLKDKIRNKLIQKIESNDKDNSWIFEFLNSISDRTLQVDITFKYIQTIKNKNFNKNLSKVFFEHFDKLFIINPYEAIEKLNTNNQQLQRKIIIQHFSKLFRINSNLSMQLLKRVSPQQKNEIREEYSYYIKEEMQQHINSLYQIQSTRNSEIKEKVILDAYSAIDGYDESREDFILEKTTPSTLAHLLISKTEKKQHKKLFLNLKKSLQQDNDRDYSKLIYKIISQSKIFEPYLFELEEFVTSAYFKKRIKEFKEQKETEQSISKMLGKVLKHPKEKREKIFMQRFKQLRKIKDLYVVIPYVAKADFELGQLLMKKGIDKKRAEEVHRGLFLNEYQNRWDRAVMAYDKIDDFYIKVDLSKTVLDSFVPDFESSFFIQAMMILDSQNISKTPMELVTIAPKEVLKYYKEIKNEVGDVLNEVIGQIVDLQKRAIKAEELNDEQGFEEILEEEKKLKISIRADEKLFELFLEKYNLNNLKFMRLNLLDFEV